MGIERGFTRAREALVLLVRPEGIEPPTSWFEARRSVRLSYGRTWEMLRPSLQNGRLLYHGQQCCCKVDTEIPTYGLSPNTRGCAVPMPVAYSVCLGWTRRIDADKKM